jgi:hypothetical protein
MKILSKLAFPQYSDCPQVAIAEITHDEYDRARRLSSIIQRVARGFQSKATLLVETDTVRFFSVSQNAVQAVVRLAQSRAESWDEFTWVCLPKDFDLESGSAGLPSEGFTSIDVSDRFLVIGRDGLSFKATDSNSNDYRSAILGLNELANYFLKSVGAAS